MSLQLSILGLAPRSLSRPCTSSCSIDKLSTLLTSTHLRTPRTFSTTLPAPANKDAKRASAAMFQRGQAAKSAKAPGKRRHAAEADPKVLSLSWHYRQLDPRRTAAPAPLRMGRNRALRHWTIHRAWLLWRRQQRARREGELMRQYQGMAAACEELRLTAGPGLRPEGYLYRVAMEKHGVYGRRGVPIEYARAQTETPGRVPWNHAWKRPEEGAA